MMIHDKIMETSVKLDGKMEQLNELLENMDEIENLEFLEYILEDLTKALDAVRVACGTINWAFKDLNE